MNRDDRYGRVAVALHWIIALLILANFPVGFWMGGSEGAAKMQVFQGHKTLGLLVLLFSLIRLCWRLTHRPPPLPRHMRRWERLLAVSVHAVLYVLMIGLPLSGWLMISASTRDLPPGIFWGMIALPDLPVPKGQAISYPAHDLHHLLIYTAYGIIGLHLVAIVKHQFIDRDGLLRRMLP